MPVVGNLRCLCCLELVHVYRFGKTTYEVYHERSIISVGSGSRSYKDVESAAWCTLHPTGNNNEETCDSFSPDSLTRERLLYDDSLFFCYPKNV